jgi:aldehyde:ferredoxin oxidoreductase
VQPILKINLSTGDIDSFAVPIQEVENYIGGASLAARLLYDELTKELNPLSDEAPLLFITGPVTGTVGPAVGRFVVAGRSPATGLWAEANCGGFWGSEIRMTGYDGLWLVGRARDPVFLVINDEGVSIRDASQYWGMETYQTQKAIQENLGNKKYRIATIGLAGEKLISFASILTDHGRLAARTGLGAVMGSKNVKAIAVRGFAEISVANKEVFNSLRTQTNHFLLTENEALAARELGTASVADYMDYLGEMPKKYYQTAQFEGAAKISGSAIADTILAGISACHGCVIACGRVVKLEDGKKRKGPEYETLVGFGPNLLISDPAVITRLGELCDRYGMDTISTSNVIGLAFKLYEDGILTIQDCSGLRLEWGKAEVVEQLIHLIANRQGIGAYMAEGARSFGSKFGAEDEAVQVNGLEAAYHDPRGSSGMALVYATSPRGACHNQSDYFLVDIGQVENSLGMKYFSRLAGAEKAKNVVIHQDWRTVFNSGVICLFANLPPQMVLDLYNAACGFNWQLSDLLKCGERGWNLKRVINNRLGLTRENDRLPKAFMKPFDELIGTSDGFVPDVQAMLEAYYEARGWDEVSGYPTERKLIELGLDWTRQDLYRKMERLS